MCCTGSLHSGGEIGTPTQLVRVLLTGQNHSPTKKENVSNIFKFAVFQKEEVIFFVLCIVLNLTDSFVKSFSLLQVLSILLHLKNPN